MCYLMILLSLAVLNRGYCFARFIGYVAGAGNDAREQVWGAPQDFGVLVTLAWSGPMVYDLISSVYAYSCLKL